MAWPILDVLDLGFQLEHAWRAARLSAALRVSSLNEVVRIIANEVLGDWILLKLWRCERLAHEGEAASSSPCVLHCSCVHRASGFVNSRRTWWIREWRRRRDRHHAQRGVQAPGGACTPRRSRDIVGAWPRSRVDESKKLYVGICVCVYVCIYVCVCVCFGVWVCVLVFILAITAMVCLSSLTHGTCALKELPRVARITAPQYSIFRVLTSCGCPRRLTCSRGCASSELSTAITRSFSIRWLALLETLHTERCERLWELPTSMHSLRLHMLAERGFKAQDAAPIGAFTALIELTLVKQDSIYSLYMESLTALLSFDS